MQAAHRLALEEEAALLFTGGQYLFRWREGQALHSKFVSPAAVRSAFSAEPIDSGWMPPGVRRWGNGPNGPWAVLFAPPARQTLSFVKLMPGREDVAEMVIPLPGLVFVCAGASCYTWAIKKEFSPEAIVYHAPLPNVDESGRICFGANPLPGGDISRAWQLFLDSPFNDHLINGKSLREPGDVRKLLVTLPGRKRYPVGDLVQASHFNATVGQVVDRVAHTKSVQDLN